MMYFSIVFLSLNYNSSSPSTCCSLTSLLHLRRSITHNHRDIDPISYDVLHGARSI